jgi:hypothetical protein
LRREIDNKQITWWVEHDIPPYDRFRCAAYFIRLELDDPSSSFTLTIWSGANRYFLERPSPEVVEQVLVKLAQDPPVIIPRRMGKATD